MGPGGGWGLGTGIALPDPTQPCTTPGTPLPRQSALRVLTAVYGQENEVVGLISVEQLTLRSYFSDIRLFTEVHNLVKIGNR